MRRRHYVTLLVVALIVGLIQIATTTASSADRGKPYIPKTQKYEPVPHSKVDTTWKRLKKSGKRGILGDRGPLPEKWAVVQTADPAKPSTFDRVPGSDGWTGDPLASLASSAASSKNAGAAKTGDLDGRYRIGLVDPGIAEKVTPGGMLFEVVAEPDADLEATFKLNYHDLAKLGGTDWATRLQLATLPACALTTPDKPACQRLTPLADSTNDPTQDEVTATLEALATGEVVDDTAADEASDDSSDEPSESPSDDPSDHPSEGAAADSSDSPSDSATGGPSADASDGAPGDLNSGEAKSGDAKARSSSTAEATLVAAVAGPGGSQGTYLASSLQSSGSWSHGGASGAFSWNYPITVTPAASGEVAPGVGVSYNSASVDGINSNANPQSSWTGLGFDYQPGYIERTFRNCKEATPSSTDKGLCWAGDILTMHLPGGATQSLVVDGTTIRPEHDNGEKIERLTGAANGSVDGEYWRVTTTDGTKYTFGAHILPGGTTTNATKSAWNVTVKGGTATDGCASKRCVRTWRWNLDMVEDVHHNVAAYYYAKETNYFVPSGTTTRTAYDRAGYLTRIDYGIKNASGSIYSGTNANPPNRVSFTVEERCKPSGTITCTNAQFVTANKDNWPDVPMDQSCTSSTTTTCNINWPTFWTRKRLATITTSYYNGTAYTNADTYALKYQWSQLSSSWVLNLDTITRTATAAGQTLTLPPVKFAYDALDSRVKGYKSLPDMVYDRLIGITSETGATTTIVYSGTSQANPNDSANFCTSTLVPDHPDDNSMECYPVNWTAPFTIDPTLDYFHKYVVVSVVEGDGAGLTPSRHTKYKYSTPGWHFDDNEVIKPSQRTWSQWRGYQTVETSTGNTNRLSENGTHDQTTRSVSTYYRGMKSDRLANGDPKPNTAFEDSRDLSREDLDQYTGMAAETRIFDDTTEIASTRYMPASLAMTATRDRSGLPPVKAYVVANRTVTESTAGTGSGTSDREKTTLTTYGEFAGQPYIQRPTSVRVTATGGTGTTTATCTTTTYADSTANWVRSAPAVVSTYSDPTDTTGGGCTGTELVARTRTYYDTKTSLEGANITLGDATKVETAADLDNGEVRYTTTGASYDTAGRLLTSTVYPDGVAKPGTARVTSIAYTFSTGGLLTGITTTLPAIAGTTTTTTQTLNAPRGTVYKSTDVAGRVTSATIDALGRYTAVWTPGRTQGTESASRTYDYQLAADKPLAVTTKTLVDPGNGATPGYDTTVQILDSRGTLRQTQTSSPVGGKVVTDSFVDSHGWVVATNGAWYTPGTPSPTVIEATTQSSIDARTTTLYDRVGRPTKVQAWRGVEATPTRTTTTIYGGDRTTVIPPAGAIATTTLLNGLGQTTELRRYTVPVTPSTFATAAANKTTYSYTAGGQIDTMTTADGTAAEATWDNTYDLLGRQVSADDPDSGTTTTKYDDTGAVTATTDATNRTVSTTYDAWARPTARYAGPATSDPKLADWTYDTLAKGALTSSRSYVVDDASGTTRTYTNTVAGYNDAGLPTGTDITLDVPGLLPKYSTRVTYTETGLPETTTLASTRDTTLNQGSYTEEIYHFYDSLGLETGLTGTNAYLSDALYTPFREASQYVLGVNNATTALTYTRDPHNRWITNTLLSGQAAPPQIENVAATYDAVGNLTRTIDTRGATGAPTQTTCYRYDSLQQLTDAWAATDNCAANPSDAVIGGPDPYWQSWEHDAAGSRIKQTIHTLPGEDGDDAVTTYTNGKDGHAHALASTETTGAVDPATIGVKTNLPSTTGATYKANGATDVLTTPDGDTQFTYRNDGSIRTITTPDGAPSAGASSEFVNDADGARLLRIDRHGGTTETTLYLPGQQVRLTETGTTKSITTNRFYSLATGQQVAVRKNNANPVFTLADPHGTTQLTVDPYTSYTNPPTKRRAFDPYGNELGRDTTPTPWVDDRTFLNKPFNPDTGLVDLGARQYDPATGRFASVDPLLNLSDPTQANGYNYANNNPVTYSDPTGTRPSCVDLSGCSSVATGVLQPTPQGPWVSYVGDDSGYRSPGLGLGGLLPNVSKAGSGLKKLLQGTLMGAGTFSSNPQMRQAASDMAVDRISEGAAEFYPEAQKAILLLTLFIPIGPPGSANAVARAALAAAERQAAQRAAAVAVLDRLPFFNAANSGSRIAANQAAGNAARDRLLAGYPGALSEQSFTTTAGVRRLDILTQGGLGIESKVGRTSLTATTRSQIAKDGLLLRNGDVTGIEWVFSRSGVTGQIGPTGPLADALSRAGIPWRLAP